MKNNNFTLLDTTLHDLTRKDVLENLKYSFINKLCNFVLSLKKVSEGDYSKLITLTDCQALSFKLQTIHEKHGKGKLEKYNMDFTMDVIHKYHSSMLNDYLHKFELSWFVFSNFKF